MKPENKWPFPVTMKEVARTDESVTYRLTAEINNAAANFRPDTALEHMREQQLQPIRIAECKHPEVAQAVVMLNDMSDKARKQALAHIGVIFKFDKGTF